MTNVVTLAWTGSNLVLSLLGLLICGVICLAIFAMSKSRTPLVGDDHH